MEKIKRITAINLKMKGGEDGKFFYAMWVLICWDCNFLGSGGGLTCLLKL